MKNAKTIYGFDLEKIICFVTRDGKITETESTEVFLRDADLISLLNRVRAWIKEINGEVASEEAGQYHIDTSELTLYCRFKCEGAEFTEAEKHLIRRNMKRI